MAEHGTWAVSPFAVEQVRALAASFQPELAGERTQARLFENVARAAAA